MAFSSQTFLAAAASVTLIALCVQCDVLHSSRGMMGHNYSNNEKSDPIDTFTCGQNTSEVVSYFVNPRDGPEFCTFVVNVLDPRFTQLRLDFEWFSLAQPEIVGADPTHYRYPAYFCNRDGFTVSSPSVGSSGNLGFTELCGENTGQHIYVPVNASSGIAPVEIAFHLADRTQINGLEPPQWKIRITQIDCCAPDTKDLCAPTGCLQYYPERSGKFESFNYNNGVGHYQGHLNYAICFKRDVDVCSIRYHPTGFQLAANNLEFPYGTAGCNMPTTDLTQPNSQDYLFIPDGHSENGADVSRYCGDYFRGGSVSPNEQGPFFVLFRTDSLANAVNFGEEIGFQIEYSQSGTGCYNASPGLIG